MPFYTQYMAQELTTQQNTEVTIAGVSSRDLGCHNQLDRNTNAQKSIIFLQ